MTESLINFDQIRLKISLRDENLSNNDIEKQPKKIAALINPFILNFANSKDKENYITVFKHLFETLEFFYKVKIITPEKFLTSTLKEIYPEEDKIIKVPDAYEINSLNFNPRQYLHYTQDGLHQYISCPSANKFINPDYLTDFRQLFTFLDGNSNFRNLPHDVSLEDICITKNYAIISTALEKKSRTILNDLEKFLRIKVLSFRSPDNSTNISRYFRSIDSAPSLNTLSEFSVTDDTKLIYAETGISSVDEKIKIITDEIKEMENTQLIKFKNYENKEKINYLDFAMLDGVFFSPIYDEDSEYNISSVAEYFPSNYFLSTVHPHLKLINKYNTFFANSIMISSL